jgi:hypothetical protein
MRSVLVFLICLGCAACAGFQHPAAEAPAPAQVALEKPAPMADAMPAKFECSDGTISTSQDACQIAMARARLPPARQVQRAPSRPAAGSEDSPTGALR